MASPSHTHTPSASSSRRRLTGAEDLLTLFRVVDIYDRYARPFLKVPPPSSHHNNHHPNTNTGSNTNTTHNHVLSDSAAPLADSLKSTLSPQNVSIPFDPKGKGKLDVDAVKSAAAPIPARGGVKENGQHAMTEVKSSHDGDGVHRVEAGTGGSGGATSGGGGLLTNGVHASSSESVKKVKMEKTYSHYVADIGGRNQIKRDKFLHTLVADPDWHHPPPDSLFLPLDESELRGAFNLEAGTVAGFDPSNWVAEEGGPKRKRKRRRDQQASDAASTPTTSQPLPIPPNVLPPKPSAALGHQTNNVKVSSTPGHASSTGTPPTSQPGHRKPHGVGDEEHRKKKRARI